MAQVLRLRTMHELGEMHVKGGGRRPATQGPVGYTDAGGYGQYSMQGGSSHPHLGPGMGLEGPAWEGPGGGPGGMSEVLAAAMANPAALFKTPQDEGLPGRHAGLWQRSKQYTRGVSPAANNRILPLTVDDWVASSGKRPKESYVESALPFSRSTAERTAPLRAPSRPLPPITPECDNPNNVMGMNVTTLG